MAGWHIPLLGNSFVLASGLSWKGKLVQTRYILQVVVLVLALLAAPAVVAQGVMDGKEAAEKGNFVRAVEIWRPLAEAGDPRAETYLGMMYDNGYGVPQDREQAFYWYQRGAEAGFARAQYHLGFMYHYGFGTTRSQSEALKWYRLAADQGEVRAQYNLGKLYAHGLVVQRDFVTAHMWFEIASRKRTAVWPLASRDLKTVAKKMSESQIEEAEERAKNWQPS